MHLEFEENVTVSKLDSLIEKAHTLVERLLDYYPDKNADFDDSAIAYRWKSQGHNAYLQAISDISDVSLNDLLCIDNQKQLLISNTEQFLNKLPANNALLWGPRGTGKSSLIKALLNEYHQDGLRVIEVDKHDLIDLAQIVELLKVHEYYYILFCDDLSFDEHDNSYKSLKVALDGSLSKTPENILIYATSNRRHIVPEYMHENQQGTVIGEELHLSDSTEEKISLSERFGLWLSFHPFNQQQYLEIIDYCLQGFEMQKTTEDSTTRTHALRWATERGSRSGRVAMQFAKYWSGLHKLQTK